MAEIKIRHGGRHFICQNGTNLLDALLEAGVFVDNPCNGKGICGKCKVKVLSEGLTPMTASEERLLKPEEISEGVRLACMAEVTGDVEIGLLKKERKHEVLTKGYLPAFEKDNFDGGYGVVIDIGTTTVVTALIDLRTGEEIASASMINAQKRYGLDVLTRITYEYEHPDCGVRKLQEVS